ncbi:MAG: MoxR family ATPase [Acidobacteriota bacterium]|nr:MoxR family ATPase [Acidobacteriota bacterium]
MKKNWNLFQPGKPPNRNINPLLPEAPPWRSFNGEVKPEYKYSFTSDELEKRGKGFQADEQGVMARMVNAALCLRRPLLVTGEPGTGKSTLSYAVAWQLQLGDVLKWPITSRSEFKKGLYEYDAIGRLQDAQLPDAERKGIGAYIKLGPLGTALLPVDRPRTLLIDEIDKSDLDLPNDLLHVFEDGEFVIPELERLDSDEPVTVKDFNGASVKIHKGRVQCRQFPFVILTSNGEREFPAPFLRRCLRLTMPEPTNDAALLRIVKARIQNDAITNLANELIGDFLKLRENRALATDQLLNAVYLLKGEHGVNNDEKDALVEALLHALSGEPDGD